MASLAEPDSVRGWISPHLRALYLAPSFSNISHLTSYILHISFTKRNLSFIYSARYQPLVPIIPLTLSIYAVSKAYRQNGPIVSKGKPSDVYEFLLLQSLTLYTAQSSDFLVRELIETSRKPQKPTGPGSYHRKNSSTRASDSETHIGGYRRMLA